jgi:predicted DNA-binding protein (UPF0251 family)
MELSLWTYDPDRDPMLAEQFQIAIDATQIRKPELIEALRDVLVEGLQATEAAQRRHIDDVTSVYRAIATVREKWDQICKDEGWEFVPLAFPREIMKALKEFQREQLNRYSDLKGRKRRKKRT